MAKTRIALDGNGSRRVLALLAKALQAKLDGKSLGDREQITASGPFRESGTLRYELAGEIGSDYTQRKYYGVQIDLVLDMLIGSMPGFVEDHLRKAVSIAAEIRRAELEGRDLSIVLWLDAQGRQQAVWPAEIEQIRERVAKRKEQAEWLLAPLSKLSKVERPARGQIRFHDIKLRIEP